MISLLIADDEDIIRTGLRVMIEKFGFEIELLEASDGLQAVDVYKAKQPDIAILDIRMPYINGLEVSEQIRQISRTSKIIILSGHNDFEYAQQAIRFGVLAYLTKPVEREKLEIVLKQAVYEANELKTNAPETRSGYEQQVRDILSGLQPRLSFQPLTMSLGWLLFPENLFVVCAKQASVGSTDFFHAFSTAFDPRPLDGYSLQFSRNNCVFIGNLPKGMDIKALQPYIQKAHAAIRQESPASYLGVSNPGSGFQSLHQLYLQCQEAMLDHLASDENDCYFYYDVQSKQQPNIPQETVDKIDSLAVVSNIGLLQGYVNDLLKIWLNRQGVSMKKAEEGLFNILLKLAIKHSSLHNSTGIADFALSRFIHMLQGCETLEEVQSLFVSAILDIIGGSDENRQLHSSHKSIVFAQDYIRKNYKKHLTLNMVSNHVAMNPSYFSSFFRKETGLTLMQYITDVRMLKAAEILRDPMYKIQDVSMMVGIDDVKYFSRIFKKNTGSSPSEYREKSK